MTTLADIYLTLFDDYLLYTQDVADQFFEGDYDLADEVLSELSDEHELVKHVGDDAWMTVPNQEQIERSEAEINAKTLPGGSVYDPVEIETEPEQTQTMSDADHARYENAVANFTHLAEHALSPQGRAFWSEQLDRITG